MCADQPEPQHPDPEERSGHLGGVFPADVLVGVVKEVVPEVSGKSSIAVITPGTDPRTVRHAFIITNF